jgi:large subunit ribosomal protein L24
MARHVRKGDQVVVTAGSDRGKVGEVLRVVEDGARVVVKGVNIRTRHVRPTQQQPKGAIVREEMPIHASNVSPSVDGKPSRVRFTVKPDGSKVRVAARGGKELGVVSPAPKAKPAKSTKSATK